MHLQERSGCCGERLSPKSIPQILLLPGVGDPNPTTPAAPRDGWVTPGRANKGLLSALGELGTSGSAQTDTGLAFQAFPAIIQLGNNSSGSWRSVTWR